MLGLPASVLRLRHLVDSTLIMQIVCCTKCKRYVHLSVMADAESPATAHDFIFTRLPRQLHYKWRLAYDNACNTAHYTYNRFPELLLSGKLFIDAMHRRGHVNCLDDYGTGAIIFLLLGPLRLQSRHACCYACAQNNACIALPFDVTLCHIDTVGMLNVLAMVG